MKLGYVVKRYPRFSETFIVNEILAHEAAGVDIEIFSLRHPVDSHFQNRLSEVRAPVTYLGPGGKSSLLLASLRAAARIVPSFWERFEALDSSDAIEIQQSVDLARHAVEKGLTHFHAHFATSATSVARMASILTGVGYSFTAHAKDIYHEAVDKEDFAQKLRDASAVVTVSDFNLRHLRAEFGAHAQKVIRIYNGLRLQDFPFSQPDTREKTILAVGRLVEKKGFESLVRATRILRDAGEKVSCEIIGTGEEEERLAELIDALNVGSFVRLAGPRPQAEVFKRIQQVAVFAAPCVVGRDGNRDGLPTVLLEAMALGTPCISTDVTGIPEVVVDGRTGLVVPPHDPAKLAEAITRLLHDVDLRVRLAQNARGLIEREFQITRNTRVLRSLFSPQYATRESQLMEAV